MELRIVGDIFNALVVSSTKPKPAISRSAETEKGLIEDLKKWG